MATTSVERMKQVHLGLGPAGYADVIKDTNTELAIFAREHEAHEEILLAKCPPTIWPHDSYHSGCPRPILVTKDHCRQLTDLHEALMAAINDIVPRWWRDKEAKFPERMPLEKDEEELLQWLDTQEEFGNLPKYSTCQGSWRPDFLVEEVQADDGSRTENFRLSEINARFAFNGFMHGSYGQLALEDMGMERSGFVGAADGAEFFDGLLDLFRHNLPLHLLKGVEEGIDITMFIHAVHRRLGREPRLITPADLRLVPNSNGNVRLCCLATPTADASEIFHTSAGEAVEEVHQVGLELHQRELVGLDREMWRQLSLRCFNDMRTVLLVHDKRMLGVIGQELASLVARGAISPAQATALDRGIAHTILPGSPQLRRLLAEPDDARHDYILKPVRGGKGAGIIFCEEMTAEAWRAAIDGLQSPALVEGASLVVQRCVRQLLYDVVLKRTGEVGRYPLVGTYHVANGKYLGIGTWRSSPERICAVSSGGAWICSVMSP